MLPVILGKLPQFLGIVVRRVIPLEGESKLQGVFVLGPAHIVVELILGHVPALGEVGQFSSESAERSIGEGQCVRRKSRGPAVVLVLVKTAPYQAVEKMN